MAFEQKDMTGALFRNKKKSQQKENAPDYTGDCMIAGYKFRIAAWLKESKTMKNPDGAPERFFAFKFEADKEQNQVPPPSPIQGQVVAAAVKHASARPAPAPAQEQEQDQIPF